MYIHICMQIYRCTDCVALPFTLSIREHPNEKPEAQKPKKKKMKRENETRIYTMNWASLKQWKRWEWGKWKNKTEDPVNPNYNRDMFKRWFSKMFYRIVYKITDIGWLIELPNFGFGNGAPNIVSHTTRMGWTLKAAK